MTDPITRVRAMAPVKEVHHALTDAAALRVWLAEHAEVDLPHRYEFWGRYTPEGDAPHQTLRYVDDETLRFGWLLDGEDTETEFRLTEDGGSTIISVYQTGYSFDDAMSGATIRGVLGTFWALTMANLVDFVEGREVGPRTDFSSSELRVLRYLPTNMTRPEIASELYVSINTVNTHLRNIYSKLGARDRSSAVQHARELRLLANGRH